MTIMPIATAQGPVLERTTAGISKPAASSNVTMSATRLWITDFGAGTAAVIGAGNMPAANFIERPEGQKFARIENGDCRAELFDDLQDVRGEHQGHALFPKSGQDLADGAGTDRAGGLAKQAKSATPALARRRRRVKSPNQGAIDSTILPK